MNPYLLQQAVEVAPFNWAQFFGTSGPLVGVAVLVTYVAKVWIDSRKEKREDKKADLEGEVGAVAAAREAVALVREQMQQLKTELAELRALREEDSKKIEKLNDRVRELESENEYLRRHGGGASR